MTADREDRLLHERTGLDRSSLYQSEIGWDGRAYVLPIYDLASGAVVGHRRGIRSEKKNGRVAWIHPADGSARLFAPGGLGPGRVLLCEGEWDALMAWQRGFNAVATTGGAKNPLSVDRLEPLRGRDVVIVFDCDDAGRAGAEKLAAQLVGVGCRVQVADLALPDDHADVSDWFAKYGRTGRQLRELMNAAPLWAYDQETADDAVEQGPQPMDWDDFWRTDPTPIHYLVDPLIADGEVTRVYAQAKVGKSLLMLDCAAGLATGRGALGETTGDRVSVLYANQENTAEDWRTRLADMGYGPEDDWSALHWFSLQAWPPLDTAAGGAALVAAVRERAVRLVVLDTQSKFLEGEEDKAFTGAAFYRHTLLPLKRLGVAVVVIDHAGNDEKKPRGSSSKRDDVDTLWRVEKVGRDRLRLVRTHGRNRHEVDDFQLIRELGPLRHVPVDRAPRLGSVAAAGADAPEETQAVRDAVAAFYGLDLDPKTSQRRAVEALRESGFSFRNDDGRAAWKVVQSEAGLER